MQTRSSISIVLAFVLAALGSLAAAPSTAFARPGAHKRLGQSVRQKLEYQGVKVKSATREKNGKGVVVVHADGSVAKYRVAFGGLVRIAAPAMAADTAIGDGTGRGLPTVTAGGQLRVNVTRDGIVDNRIVAFGADPAKGRVDGATKPVPTRAVVEQKAYFNSLSDPGASADQNWAAAQASESARAAASRATR